MRSRWDHRTSFRRDGSIASLSKSSVPAPFQSVGAALLSLAIVALAPACSARSTEHPGERPAEHPGVRYDAAASDGFAGATVDAELVPDPATTFEALGAHGLSLDVTLANTLAAPGGALAESPLAWARPSKRPWDALFCNQRPNDTIRLDPADTFSLRTSYWMAWLSLQGYGSQRAKPKLRKAGFSRFRVIEDRATGLLGFIASTPDFTVVSYSGSADMKDWLHDLTFDQIRDTTWAFPGRFHRGFYNAIQGRWQEILDETSRQSAGKPVYVTGHSLGGAMAILTAARLANAGLPVASVYAFAAPRVGDEEFAARYDALLGARTWRFNNNEDIIPHLGPSSGSALEFSRLFVGEMGSFLHDFFVDARYSHVGTLLRFDPNGVVGVPEREDLAQERAFWNAIYERSDGKNLLQKALLNWRLAGDHIPNSNFCYLKR